MNRNTPLRTFIAREADDLRGTLRLYLLRAGINESPDDLLNDVVVEALAHESRFDSTRAPRAWLLGIAANLIRRRRANAIRLHQREPLIRDLHNDDAMSEDDLFDWLAGIADDRTPEDELLLRELLAGISPEDAHVIQLGIISGLSGEALARTLGVAPGAARVRLHRAIARLRAHAAKAIGDGEEA